MQSDNNYSVEDDTVKFINRINDTHPNNSTINGNDSTDAANTTIHSSLDDCPKHYIVLSKD